VPVIATEFNSVSSYPGKESTSLVDGLFVADSLGSLMSSGYSGGIVWDLRQVPHDVLAEGGLGTRAALGD
jgi:hypothetical protein